MLPVLPDLYTSIKRYSVKWPSSCDCEDGTALQSSAPQLPEDEINTIIKNLFFPDQVAKMHHFHKCRNIGCNGISNEEMVRVKMAKKKDRFQHEWLFKGRHTFARTVVSGGWCTWKTRACIAYSAVNITASLSKTESETFSSDPSTRFKLSSVKEHMVCTKHQTTLKNELLKRVSYFQKQLDEKESTTEPAQREGLGGALDPPPHSHFCAKNK